MAGTMWSVLPVQIPIRLCKSMTIQSKQNSRKVKIIELIFKMADRPPSSFSMKKGTKQLSKMTVFNDQAHIQIGGQWNDNLRHVDRPFRGILAGISFNGLRPFDLAAANDVKVKTNGDVRKLNR